MTDIISILHDVIGVLDSVILMKSPIKELATEGKAFLEAFKSGDVEKAKVEFSKLHESIEKMEDVFKDQTLEAVMDLYKQISHIMHLHIGEGEKKLCEYEKVLNLNTAKKILAKFETHTEE